MSRTASGYNNCTAAGLFALRQAYNAYKFCNQQIQQCDEQINRVINSKHIAIKAMARKLAKQYYHTMIDGVEFAEYGIKKYEEQIKQQ
jgi:hypothetical protein